jgi:hypothetical protein
VCSESTEKIEDVGEDGREIGKLKDRERVDELGGVEWEVV